MTQEQVVYKIADQAFATTDYQPHIPIAKREPDHEECTFEYRPAEGPDEVIDDNRWTCLRTYELTKADLNRALDDFEINRIKMVMIRRLSEESGNLTSYDPLDYRLAFKVWEACDKNFLTVWLE